VIGMDMRVDDVMYPHAGIVGGLQVGLNVADRINDRPGRFATAAEEVGDADWIAMQELSENHGLALPDEKRYTFNRSAE
jgi:hypothetical protein